MEAAVVVGISGASGACYGLKTLQLLAEAGIPTELVISEGAERTIRAELGVEPEEIAGQASKVYPNDDLGAALASGSYPTRGMIIAPCSVKTLSQVAYCHADTLLARAADVTLKQRRGLVLLVRETPLHYGHLQAMAAVTQAGAVVFPPVPAFYAQPQTLDDMVEQTVRSALLCLGIDLPGRFVWGGSQ